MPHSNHNTKLYNKYKHTHTKKTGIKYNTKNNCHITKEENKKKKGTKKVYKNNYFFEIPLCICF